jgi:hypothetical protein
MSFANRAAGCDAAFDCGPSAKDHRLGERIAYLIDRRRCFELFKVPSPGVQADGDCLRFRFGERASVERHPPHTELRSLSRRDCRAAAERRAAVFRLADAHEKQSLDTCRRAGQVEHLVATASELAAVESSSENSAESAVERSESIINTGARRQGENEQRCVERAKIGSAHRKSEAHVGGPK